MFSLTTIHSYSLLLHLSIIILVYVSAHITEHELLLEFLQELCAPLDVNEEGVNLSNVTDIYFS